MIETIENKWNVAIYQLAARRGLEQNGADPALKLMAERPSLWPLFLFCAHNEIVAPPVGALEQPAIEVRINHGVWQTRCAFCPSAQHAAKTDHWFYCVNCRNVTVGNCAIPVIWPEEPERIEALLLKRLQHNQNWEPWETPEDLEKENDLFLGAS